MLMMTGRFTMLGISRWTERRDSSYQTIQRWYNTVLPWAEFYGGSFKLGCGTHSINIYWPVTKWSAGRWGPDCRKRNFSLMLFR
jgi:hypothetical protein